MRRATFKRPHGVRHMFAADDMRTDKLYGHIKPRKRRGEFLAFLRYVRSMHPREQGPAIRRYIAWRNRNPHDRALCRLVDRAKVA